jgi:hypothetical protein
VTHHEQMIIYGGLAACAIVFLRGLLFGDGGRVDRPGEEWVDYTSNEGAAGRSVLASAARCTALSPRVRSSIRDATYRQGAHAARQPPSGPNSDAGILQYAVGQSAASTVHEEERHA